MFSAILYLGLIKFNNNVLSYRQCWYKSKNDWLSANFYAVEENKAQQSWETGTTKKKKRSQRQFPYLEWNGNVTGDASYSALLYYAS